MDLESEPEHKRGEQELDSDLIPLLPSEKTRRWLVSYHGLLAAISLGVIVMAAVMRSEGPSDVFLPGMKVALPDICLTKSVLGVPCPGCGMTRSFIAIAHGQWRRAWDFNPVSFLMFVFIAGQIPWRFWQIRRILHHQVELDPIVFFIPMVVMVVLLFTQWFVKMLF
jgi:hypothetical protein